MEDNQKSIFNDPTTPPCLVNANQVAHQLFVNGRGNMPTKPNRPILTTVEQSEQSLRYPFTEEEYRKSIATLKNNKTTGIDDVLVEQLKHLGHRAHMWLHSMLILKLGKEASIPKSYRQTSLLCHTYKLYERLILNRITPTVKSHLIKEQACFRPGMSCTSHPLNLSQHIEDGYQNRMITVR